MLGLREYVSDARCAHTYKHLNEVGTRHGEEGHARFARHGFRKQGLTGSRRANEQCSLGNLSAQFGVFLWVLEEVDDLLHLLFGTLLACYVLKGYAHLASLVVELGLAFPTLKMPPPPPPPRMPRVMYQKKNINGRSHSTLTKRLSMSPLFSFL